MTDAQGPGSHVLYQDFIVPLLVASATLDFDLFVGNRAGVFVSPASLDFSTPALNQQARVDILRGGADPFSVGQKVTVVVSVPHRLAGDGPEVLLDMRGLGRVVRMEGPERHRLYAEDGISLTGVAIEFAGPLSFQYRWA